MRPQYFIVAAAIVIGLVSMPLIFKWVPKNRLYGVRTHLTMSGTEAQWYSVNQASGVALFIAAVASLLAFAVLSRFQLVDTSRLVIYLAIFLY